jgi:hypothetical protein
VRECYRLKLRAMLSAGVAMVVIARKGAGELDWRTTDAELLAGAVALRHKLTANPGTESKTKTELKTGNKTSTEAGPESRSKAPTKPSTRTNLRERERP